MYQSDSIEPDESHHARAAAVGNQPAVDQEHLQGATTPAAVTPAAIAPKVAPRCYWCSLAYAADVSGGSCWLLLLELAFNVYECICVVLDQAALAGYAVLVFIGCFVLHFHSIRPVYSHMLPRCCSFKDTLIE